MVPLAVEPAPLPAAAISWLCHSQCGADAIPAAPASRRSRHVRAVAGSTHKRQHVLSLAAQCDTCHPPPHTHTQARKLTCLRFLLAPRPAEPKE